MKIHPILFSTPMVQAILEGRKIMTRRILKLKGCKPFIPDPDQYDKASIFFWNKNYHPYGQNGDILWVREKFRLIHHYGFFDYKLYQYADENTNAYCPIIDPDQIIPMSPWKPSIHMPQAACRIFLENTDIKVERLQDITEEDAVNEGILKRENKITGEIGYLNPFRTDNLKFDSAVLAFRDLWIKINGEDSWNSNPWVWVISFERCEKPENF